MLVFLDSFQAYIHTLEKSVVSYKTLNHLLIWKWNFEWVRVDIWLNPNRRSEDVNRTNEQEKKKIFTYSQNIHCYIHIYIVHEDVQDVDKIHSWIKYKYTNDSGYKCDCVFTIIYNVQQCNENGVCWACRKRCDLCICGTNMNDSRDIFFSRVCAILLFHVGKIREFKNSATKFRRCVVLSRHIHTHSIYVHSRVVGVVWLLLRCIHFVKL